MSIASMLWGGGRIAVQVDTIAKQAFDDFSARKTEDEALGFLRVVSTHQKLQSLIGEDDVLSVGDWLELEVDPNHKASGPQVWSLQLSANRLIGPEDESHPARGKLISIRRLSRGSTEPDPQPLGATVPGTRAKGRSLRRAFSLRNLQQPLALAEINKGVLKRWNRAWSMSSATALDVGQASFNVVEPIFNNGPTLCVDVGQPIWFHIHSLPKDFNRTYYRGGIVVLTHWDTDHYAYGRQNPEFHRMLWIAPAQNSVGPNAHHFAMLLKNKGKLLLVGSASNRRHRRGASILRCTGATNNGSGLALHLRTCGRNILFTGDADYQEIPSLRGIRFDAVQVPHHGGRQRLPVGIPEAASQNSKAVISCGLPNRYGHPNLRTVESHERENWRVQITAAWRGHRRGDIPL